MEIILTSILAFISTNMDDIFLLMLFFSDRNFKKGEIIAGQFLGIAVLILISVGLSLAGLVISPQYIGLLGLLPIFYGVKGLIHLFRKNTTADEQTPVTKTNNNILTVSGVTIANGGDNIGIYGPLFAALNWSDKFSMITIFFIMTGLWCVLAKYVSAHPVVAKAIDLYGHRITPFILIALGIYILHESNSIHLFF